MRILNDNATVGFIKNGILNEDQTRLQLLLDCGYTGVLDWRQHMVWKMNQHQRILWQCIVALRKFRQAGGLCSWSRDPHEHLLKEALTTGMAIPPEDLSYLTSETSWEFDQTQMKRSLRLTIKRLREYADTMYGPHDQWSKDCHYAFDGLLTHQHLLESRWRDEAAEKKARLKRVSV